MAVNVAGMATRFASDIVRRATVGQQQAYSSLLLAGVLAAVGLVFILSDSLPGMGR